MTFTIALIASPCTEMVLRKLFISLGLLILLTLLLVRFTGLSNLKNGLSPNVLNMDSVLSFSKLLNLGFYYPTTKLFISW